jgi:hypothetical protein
MKTITDNQLIEHLTSFRGASWVSVITRTIPKMVVKHRETREPNPYLDKVFHVCTRHGMIGADYQNVVRNRREKENHPEAQAFEAEEIWQGYGSHATRIIIQHLKSKKLYLSFYPRITPAGEHVITDSKYISSVENIEIDKNLLEPYFVSHGTAIKKQEVSQAVLWNTIFIGNIVEISMAGEQYIIIR